MGLVRRMRKPPRPRYTAADILGLPGQPPTYPGGLRSYLRDTRADAAYRLWHLWATKGKCSTCDRALLDSMER